MVIKHSNVVGGSTAALRRICNGSIDLSQGLPAEGWNAYAAEGSALHHIVEAAIRQNLADEDVLMQHAESDREGVRITRDHLVNKALPALEWFEREVPLSAKIFLEKEVDFLGLIEGAFGTSDVIFDDTASSGRCGLVDWKFGDGYVVSASENDQMRFYLAGAIHTGLLPAGLDQYEAWIFQPAAKLQPEQYASQGLYSWDDLQHFVQDLKNAVEGERRFVSGDHCRWCKAKTRCDAYKKMLSADVDTDIATVGANEMAHMLNRIPAIEAYIAELKAAAFRNAQNGIQIPGYALETALGNRAWKDADSAWGALGRMGLAADQRTVKTVISPTVAEKLLKKLDTPKPKLEKFMKLHVHRPENGEKLIKSDKPSEHTFARIASAIKARTA